MKDDNSADGPLSDPTQTFGRQSDDEPKTGLIRRVPTGAIPIVHPADDSAPATSIIRRMPTGAIPIPVADADADAPQTSIIEPTATGLILSGLVEPEAPGTANIAAPSKPRPKSPPGPFAAAATATACILSGWATAVIATSLISGWWRTDPLFCVAIGFLAAVGCGATIGGQIAVLLRHRTGRMLVVVGALVTLVIFASLFVAGAKLPPIVYGIPVLPVVSIVLAMLPVTGRWCTKI